MRSIREAFDGRDALEILRSEGADLVFTDYKMAPMDGLDLVKQVGRERPRPTPSRR